MELDPGELQDSARQALSDAGLPANEEKTSKFMVDLGWLLLSVPGDVGGLGQGLSAASALYLEMGRSLCSPAFLSSMLALEAMTSAPYAPERQACIDRILDGQHVAVPLVRSFAQLSTSASGRPLLSGKARGVPSADRACELLIWPQNGAYVALVPASGPGINVMSCPTWDETRRLFEVEFSDVELEPYRILAEGEAAREVALSLHTHLDFALAADCVGGAAALLEMTVAYLGTRKQFGRPLAMFQALKHRCADRAVSLAAAEALLLANLRIYDCGGQEGVALAMMAKSIASSAFRSVAEDAIQLHGGIAMTSEHPSHLFLKRALLNEHIGTPNLQCEMDLGARTLRDAPSDGTEPI